jgi:hypothetical protein
LWSTAPEARTVPRGGDEMAKECLLFSQYIKISDKFGLSRAL